MLYTCPSMHDLGHLFFIHRDRNPSHTTVNYNDGSLVHDVHTLTTSFTLYI